MMIDGEEVEWKVICVRVDANDADKYKGLKDVLDLNIQPFDNFRAKTTILLDPTSEDTIAVWLLCNCRYPLTS